MTQAISWIPFSFNTPYIDEIHVIEGLVLPPHYRLIKSNVLSAFGFDFLAHCKTMDIPHQPFSLTLLNNSNLLELESA